MVLRALAPFLLPCVLACGAEPTTPGPPGPLGPDVDAPPATRDCELVLGSGVRQFQAVSDGQTLPLYKGPQGGYMIYLSIRARGFDPSRVNFCYVEKFAEGGGEFGNKCWLVKLTTDLGDGWWERVGIWGEVNGDYWTSPQKIRDKDAIIEATLTDDKGCRAEDGFAIHVDLDPGR